MDDETKSSLSALATKLPQLVEQLRGELKTTTGQVSNLAGTIDRNLSELAKHATTLANTARDELGDPRLEVTKWLWGVGVAVIGYLIAVPPWDKLYQQATPVLSSIFKKFPHYPFYHLTLILGLLGLSLLWGVIYVLTRTKMWFRLQFGCMAAPLVLSTVLVLSIPGWHRDTFRLRLAVTEDPIRYSYSVPGIPLIVPGDAKISLHIDEKAKVGLNPKDAEVKLAPDQTVKLAPGSLEALDSIKRCLESEDLGSCKGLAKKIEGIVNSIKKLSPERSPQKER